MARLSVPALILGLIAAPFATGAKADELADVKAAILKADAVFDAHDAKLAASIYAPDVVWQNPFSVRFHSEAQLERFLTNLFKRPGYLAGHDIDKTVVTDVRLLGPDRVSAWTLETSTGQIDDHTGKPVGLRKSHTLDVLEKRSGVWWVVDELIMDEKLPGG